MKIETSNTKYKIKFNESERETLKEANEIIKNILCLANEYRLENFYAGKNEQVLELNFEELTTFLNRLSFPGEYLYMD